MGTWGTSLYEDDEALDIRDSIAILSKMPIDGERTLELLLENFDRDFNLEDEDAPIFWLTVADQFEKKGIGCDKVLQMAIQVIEGGADLRALEGRGMEVADLVQRKKLLDKLLLRFKNPKTTRPLSKPALPPKLCVCAGQIYAYPTMNGQGMNAWFSSWEAADFNPDGAGALIILATGRAFDWFPWCAYTPVNINPHEQITLDKVLASKTTFREGVGYCAPKQTHFKKMGMSLLGSATLDPAKVDAVMQMCPRKPSEAIINDWSICTGAFSTSNPDIGFVPVASLLA